MVSIELRSPKDSSITLRDQFKAKSQVGLTHYIHDYNHERIKIKLKGLSSVHTELSPFCPSHLFSTIQLPGTVKHLFILVTNLFYGLNNQFTMIRTTFEITEILNRTLTPIDVSIIRKSSLRKYIA